MPPQSSPAGCGCGCACFCLTASECHGINKDKILGTSLVTCWNEQDKLVSSSFLVTFPSFFVFRNRRSSHTLCKLCLCIWYCCEKKTFWVSLSSQPELFWCAQVREGPRARIMPNRAQKRSSLSVHFWLEKQELSPCSLLCSCDQISLLWLILFGFWGSFPILNLRFV